MRVLTLICVLFFMVLPSTVVYGQVTEKGIASFYSDALEGRATASGELYQSKKLTAAHRSLPFDTRVKVTNVKNNKSVVVRINDRGPFVDGRILDLSKKAAIQLGFVDQGIVEVRLEVLKNK